MKPLLATALLLAGLLVGPAYSDEAEAHAVSEPLHLVMETSMGDIVLELFEDEAPITVQNFLAYVESGFFEGTIFHRVIPNFMIQGGGFEQTLQRKETLPPIQNEAFNGLPNERGTIAMARTTQVDSATSQFFINLAHNEFLNHGVRDFGYAVFGRVIEGMEVVDEIAGVPTRRSGGHANLPRSHITIERVSLATQNNDD